MKHWPLCLSALLCAFAIATVTAAAEPGDRLYIQIECANIRAGPSADTPIVMQAELGRALFEFQRVRGWVQIGIENSGGKIGWTDRRFVGPEKPRGTARCG